MHGFNYSYFTAFSAVCGDLPAGDLPPETYPSESCPLIIFCGDAENNPSENRIYYQNILYLVGTRTSEINI